MLIFQRFLINLHKSWSRFPWNKYLFCVEKMHSLYRLEGRLEENCLIVSSNTRWYVMQLSLFVEKNMCILSHANEESPLKLTSFILPSLTPTTSLTKGLFLSIEKHFSFFLFYFCCWFTVRTAVHWYWYFKWHEVSHHVTILDFILSGVSFQPNGENQWQHRVV